MHAHWGARSAPLAGWTLSTPDQRLEILPEHAETLAPPPIRMYTYDMSNTPPRPADLLFPEARRQDAIDLGFCVLPPFGCGQPVTGFTDPLSRREFAISGLCQTCQDKVFGTDDDVDEFGWYDD